MAWVALLLLGLFSSVTSHNKVSAYSSNSHDHNIFEGISQQPYALGPNVLASAKTNLRLRQSLLKLYYRHFIARKGLGVIYKPLFIDFPTNEEVFVNEIIETEFIIGHELLVTPILVERTTTRTVYFPKDSNWYDFFSGKRYQGRNVAQITTSMTDAVPMFIREGTGVVVQDVSKIRKTKEMNNVFTIKAGLAKSDSGTYCATVGLLSIIDFNNDTQIDQCLADGCDYNISLEVTITKDAKSISMSVDYLGGTGLNQEQIINSLVLFHETEGTITVNLTEPIKIQGKLALTVKQFNYGKQAQVFTTASDMLEKREEVQQPSQDYSNTQSEGGSQQDDSSATDNITTTAWQLAAGKRVQLRLLQGQSTTSQTPELEGITKEEMEILRREELEAQIAEKARFEEEEQAQRHEMEMEAAWLKEEQERTEKEKLRAQQEKKDKLEQEKVKAEQEKKKKADRLKDQNQAKQKAKLKAKQAAEKLEAEKKRRQTEKAEKAEKERLRKETEKAKQQKEKAQRVKEKAGNENKQQEEREKIKADNDKEVKQKAAKEQSEKDNRGQQEKVKAEKLRAQKDRADQAILSLKKEKTGKESQNTEVEETLSETQHTDDSVQQSEQTVDEGEQQSSSETPSDQKPQATGEESTVEETSESDDQQPGQVSEPDSENSGTQEGTWISSTYNKAKEFYEEQRMGLLIGGGVFLLLILLWVGIRFYRKWLQNRHNLSKMHVQGTETRIPQTGQTMGNFFDEQS